MTFSASGFESFSLWLSLEMPWRSQSGWISAKRRLISSNLGGCCTGNGVVILILRQHLWFVVEYGMSEIHNLGSLWSPSICPTTFSFLHLSCHYTPLTGPSWKLLSQRQGQQALMTSTCLLLCPSFCLFSVFFLTWALTVDFSDGNYVSSLFLVYTLFLSVPISITLSIWCVLMTPKYMSSPTLFSQLQMHPIPHIHTISNQGS